jgi:hypothetical protein
MKRKVTARRRGQRPYDIRMEFSKEQLAGVGAMAFMWNEIEAMLNLLLCVCLMLPPALWREVHTRIHGIDGTIAIIRAASALIFYNRGGWIENAITDTFAAATQYKGYRDTIIHSRIIDVNSGIGEMSIRRGKIEEVLLSTDALNRLYEHMWHLHREIMELVTFFEHWRDRAVGGGADRQIASRLAAMDEGKYGVTTLIGTGAPPDEQGLQDAIARYQHYQRQRKSLQPLPSFPPLPPDPERKGEKKEGRVRKRKEVSDPKPL